MGRRRKEEALRQEKNENIARGETRKSQPDQRSAAQTRIISPPAHSPVELCLSLEHRLFRGRPRRVRGRLVNDLNVRPYALCRVVACTRREKERPRRGEATGEGGGGGWRGEAGRMNVEGVRRPFEPWRSQPLPSPTHSGVTARATTRTPSQAIYSHQHAQAKRKSS